MLSTNGHRVRIIHLEDFADETQVIENLVKKGGFPYEWRWISSKEEYAIALREFHPDIILSDHSMPNFSSVEAFKLLRESRLDIPFILVTATVSEEFAVMMMREGIADYVLKDRLQRLPVAIQSALQKWNSSDRISHS
ncbi:MAG: response regulator [Bacteroidota bacterium]